MVHTLHAAVPSPSHSQKMPVWWQRSRQEIHQSEGKTRVLNGHNLPDLKKPAKEQEKQSTHYPQQTINDWIWIFYKHNDFHKWHNGRHTTLCTCPPVLPFNQIIHLTLLALATWEDTLIQQESTQTWQWTTNAHNSSTSLCHTKHQITHSKVTDSPQFRNDRCVHSWAHIQYALFERLNSVVHRRTTRTSQAS